jgi:long-chain fatty acid transport protein
MRGDGDAWGWNLGAMYREGPFSVGASFHSQTTVDVDGDYTRFGSPTIDGDADLHLPSRFQLGVRYMFNAELAAEIDWSRTGWSTFEDILVTSSANGAVLTRSVNDWDDANAYRLSLTYELTPSTQLRFGYTYDETGQPSEFFSARIPDADRQTFSIGARHSLSGGWQLEGGYMFVTWDDNNFRGNRPFNPSVSRDVNGTSALNGKYEATAHILGIGVNKTIM